MSKGIGIFVSFLVGASVGASTSYFILKEKFEKEKDEIYENEVKPAREEYFNKIEELNNENKKRIEENRAAKVKMSDMMMEMTKQMGYTSENEKPADPVDEHNDANLPSIPDPVDIHGPTPYFITQDDYADEGYEKESLVFYTNQIAVNENYEPIDDLENLIGADNLKQLSKMIDDRIDICWIRNDNLSTDFEIQLADYDFND